MASHWHPETFEEFRSALDDGRCQIVLHQWTQSWAESNGWCFLGIYSRRLFKRRLRLNEKDFWSAYRACAFDLHLDVRRDIAGCPSL